MNQTEMGFLRLGWPAATLAGLMLTASGCFDATCPAGERQIGDVCAIGGSGGGGNGGALPFALQVFAGDRPLIDFDAATTDYESELGFLADGVSVSVSSSDQVSAVTRNGSNVALNDDTATIEVNANSEAEIVVTTTDDIEYTVTVSRGAFPACSHEIEQRFVATTPTDFSRYGEDVAVSNNLIVVAAPGCSDNYRETGDDARAALAEPVPGSVQVLRRIENAQDPSAPATVVVEDTLLGDDEQDEACFGKSVAVDGETIVVGAPFERVGSNDAQGRVYIFECLERDGARCRNWEQTAELDTRPVGADQRFGQSVAIQGDLLVVGATRADQDEQGGRVEIFERDDSASAGWSRISTLQGVTVNDDNFGESVAIDGDRIAVGAKCDGGGSEPGIDGCDTGQGAAYVYLRKGAEVWEIEGTKLVGSMVPVGGQFGHQVSISGDTLVVSAPQVEPFINDVFPDNPIFGEAYVFERAGSTWVESARLVATPTMNFWVFGIDIEVQGDVIAVGAQGTQNLVDHDSDPATRFAIAPGAIFVFQRVGAEWVQRTVLVSNPEDSRADFGHSLALDGDVLVAGARDEEPGDNFDEDNSDPTDQAQGAAYSYRNFTGDTCTIP